MISAPSASADKICVSVTLQGTLNYSTGNICRYEYPFGTACGGQDYDIQRPPLVASYEVCAPVQLLVAEGEQA